MTSKGRVLGAFWMLTVACFSTGAIKMADFISPCSFEDPQAEDCSLKQAKVLHPFLVAGIKEWGVPYMNPLLVPEIRFARLGLLSLHMNITNSSHHGWRDIQYKSVKFNTKNLTLDATWTIDKYNGSGNYKVVGHVLQVPVYGEGWGAIHVGGIFETLHVQYEKEIRNGEYYLRPVKVDTKIYPKSVHYDIRNLFGNEALSNIMNDFLNTNSLAVYQEVRSVIEDITAEIMLTIMKKNMASIPTKEMFTGFKGFE